MTTIIELLKMKEYCIEGSFCKLFANEDGTFDVFAKSQIECLVSTPLLHTLSEEIAVSGFLSLENNKEMFKEVIRVIAMNHFKQISESKQ